MEADRGFVVGIGCLSSSAKWLYFYPVTLSDRESESELVLISDWLRPQGQARRGAKPVPTVPGVHAWPGPRAPPKSELLTIVLFSFLLVFI